MKRNLFLMMVLAIVFMVVSVNSCEAKDVWVARWQSSNAEVYVMDETLVWEENLQGKFFLVSTKEVQNGKLKRIVKWKYIKYGQEMWRYETDQMNGNNMTVVSPGDRVFDFCMKRIGWQYRTEDFWCY